MHVGLNLVYLQADSGGTGTYARELVAGLGALGHRVTAWVGRDAPGWIFGSAAECVRLPVRSAGSPVHVGVELLALGLDARRRGVDVVHGLAYCAPVLAPGVATVVTLHDLTWRHHPDAATRLARGMFGLLTPLCGGLCDRVIVPSAAARDDLVASVGLDAAKIVVVPHGVSAPPAVTQPLDRERVGLAPGARVLLSVGQMAAHKNLTTLVAALPMLPGDVVLVAPGRRTGYADVVLAAARAAGVAERVVLPGFVTDAQLEALYVEASAFVLPSVSEGFGLPVLEAMARGVPVACSGTTSLPEVAGGAAELFDPRDPAALATAVRSVLDDPDPFVARGRARAAAMTWEATARATARTYERAIASRVVCT